MAKWLITWINNGKFQGKEIVPAGLPHRSHDHPDGCRRRYTRSTNPDVHVAGYGLGWFISSYRGHYRVEHGGGIDGLSPPPASSPATASAFHIQQPRRRYPASATGLPTACSNSPTALEQDPARCREKANEAAKAIQKNTGSNTVAGTQPSHELKAYAGVFSQSRLRKN